MFSKLSDRAVLLLAPGFSPVILWSPAASAASAASCTVEKPLKRLWLPHPPNTGLKPGANETGVTNVRLHFQSR
jgi:hypothetical protein